MFRMKLKHPTFLLPETILFLFVLLRLQTTNVRFSHKPAH